MSTEKRPNVDLADFSRLDLRVGRIVEVDVFPEARRPAYKLRIDFGEPLGVLASSAQITRYSISELRGRLVVAVVNLGNRQIGPITSQCLVLAAVDSDGLVHLLGVEATAPLGSQVS